MPGSSLRNAVQRRNHKERSQPVGRQKLGLLEKHKDYVLRAKDHNVKQQRLKRLREIAAMRNKDEFNFGMVRTKTVNGVHVQDRGNEALKNDVVALLKTQDAGYVRLHITKERRKIDKLKERIAIALPGMREEWLDEKEGRKQTLQRAGLLRSEKVKGKAKAKADEDDWELDLLDGIDDDMEGAAGAGSLVGGMGKKTVWLDDVDQARAYGTAPAATAPTRTAALRDDMDDLDDDDDDDDEGSIGDFGSSSEDDATAPSAASARRKGEKHLGYLVSELRSRQERLDSLREAAEKLGLVKALMTTKGQAARRQSSQKQSLTDAVAAGKMTANGLALPGNESDDDDDEKDGRGRKKPVKKMFKWSKERKR
ncbi:uncharacterized protein PFL1_03360 [Pseudozyma flocculosa PF-1]|uniref:Related to UTP11 - subunit of U3-containing small subunit processome complex n=2 Tax=Pseudozyma flocculosa TaxID=84751 RepID=A0A5C3F8T1_9BASI|nr:uncharacterized protein PFL1_03360 [Pseudozyma flocculosa PF-1]EPQ29071.1 hypothetical protein PFL1_03360 [Pseudozyma flocculosa PF-1]SPO40065.1 related to UTP11 - subunit of U3-containing small subunit processome complex [Pseudozyma flocculosa]